MKISNATVLLLTGVAIGAIAGLLLAPDEGTQTRKKWMKKAKKYKNNIFLFKKFVIHLRSTTFSAT